MKVYMYVVICMYVTIIYTCIGGGQHELLVMRAGYCTDIHTGVVSCSSLSVAVTTPSSRKESVAVASLSCLEESFSSSNWFSSTP